MRWLCALVIGSIVTVFTFLLVTGEYINDGPVVAEVTARHGLHAGDFVVVAGWAVAMVALVALVLLARRPDRARTR